MPWYCASSLIQKSRPNAESGSGRLRQPVSVQNYNHTKQKCTSHGVSTCQISRILWVIDCAVPRCVGARNACPKKMWSCWTRKSPLRRERCYKKWVTLGAIRHQVVPSCCTSCWLCDNKNIRSHTLHTTWLVRVYPSYKIVQHISLQCLQVQQKTPVRVLHRRAELSCSCFFWRPASCRFLRPWPRGPERCTPWKWRSGNVTGIANSGDLGLRS